MSRKALAETDGPGVAGLKGQLVAERASVHNARKAQMPQSDGVADTPHAIAEKRLACSSKPPRINGFYVGRR